MRTPRVTIPAAVAATAIVVWQVRGRRRQRALGWSPSSAVALDAGLHVRRLGEAGPVVLLLHGLAASGGYWGGAYDGLAAVSRLVIPDLLGFGASPRPAHGYGAEEHVDAILDCLDQLGLSGEPLIIGAHSLGVLVALRLAARKPELVLGIAGFGPPVYPDRSTASKHLGRLGAMAQLSTVDQHVAHALCAWVCAHRRTAAVLARVLVPELPGPIAAAGVEHSWPSFSETLKRVILAGEARAWIDGSTTPVEFIVGSGDRAMDVPYLQELAGTHSNVNLRIWPGTGHDLPLTRSLDAVDVLIALGNCDTEAEAKRTPGPEIP